MSELIPELKNVRVYHIYHCGSCGKVVSRQALDDRKCDKCGMDFS